VTKVIRSEKDKKKRGVHRRDAKSAEGKIIGRRLIRIKDRFPPHSFGGQAGI
jgi:hypothetical protein